MLDKNDIMEELSLAYVSAVAAVAGYALEETRRDKDSVDLRICARGHVAPDATLQSPEIAVQLKSWMVAPPNEPTLSYPLKQKNYDDLRGRRMVPRILVLFTMPTEQTDWLSLDEASLVLKRCAYWMSLRHHPATSNETSTTIRIDRTNIFDAAALRSLIGKAAAEEEL